MRKKMQAQQIAVAAPNGEMRTAVNEGKKELNQKKEHKNWKENQRDKKKECAAKTLFA